MITNPTDEIGARMALITDNRSAVESLLNYEDLPAPTVISRPEAVYVSVADADDLLPWLNLLGGVVHRAPAWAGLELWSLTTFTPPGSSGVRVPVRVSVTVPTGEQLLHGIVSAVAA
ncbi:hypothetical protein OHU11_30165 [Streptomyces sp. NBC_00257]|uniref:hypothetical protein n=1 Tax=unclassified Streptomyces TaxID=2593676 RepID=UPI00225056BB|nr:MULTISPECIES: hypothetical protein [unclassified Streptomyces]MCX5431919.1 hypothetical protein [Streptomyces sp. NBC_00062]